jgi:hypothetical protein
VLVISGRRILPPPEPKYAPCSDCGVLIASPGLCVPCQKVRHTPGAPTRLPRIELPSLRSIRDADQRFFLRMYLRSNIDRDQDIARARCEQYGVDYQTARAEARAT